MKAGKGSRKGKQMMCGWDVGNRRPKKGEEPKSKRERGEKRN